MKIQQYNVSSGVEIAKSAQRINREQGLSWEKTIKRIIAGARRQAEVLRKMREMVFTISISDAYNEYREQIGKNRLSRLDKQVALLNYIVSGKYLE